MIKAPGECCACHAHVADVPSHYVTCRELAAALPTHAEMRTQAIEARQLANPSQAGQPCFRCGRKPRAPGLSHCQACRHAAAKRIRDRRKAQHA